MLYIKVFHDHNLFQFLKWFDIDLLDYVGYWGWKVCNDRELPTWIITGYVDLDMRFGWLVRERLYEILKKPRLYEWAHRKFLAIDPKFGITEDEFREVINILGVLWRLDCGE